MAAHHGMERQLHKAASHVISYDQEPSKDMTRHVRHTSKSLSPQSSEATPAECSRLPGWPLPVMVKMEEFKHSLWCSGQVLMQAGGVLRVL